MKNDPEVLRARDRLERKRLSSSFRNIIGFVVVASFVAFLLSTFADSRYSKMLESKFEKRNRVSKMRLNSNGPIFNLSDPVLDKKIDSIKRFVGDELEVNRVWKKRAGFKGVRILFVEKGKTDSYYMGYIRMNHHYKIPVELKNDDLSEIIMPKKMKSTSVSWRINYNDDLLEFDNPKRISDKFWKQEQK